MKIVFGIILFVMNVPVNPHSVNGARPIEHIKKL